MIENLKAYLEANIAPILLEKVDSSIFNDIATIIPANIKKEELIGYYENNKLKLPEWYYKVKEKESSNLNILVIDNITSISLEEQEKFYELLKYKKIINNKLPHNCRIIILCQNSDIENINKNIYNLIIHIK